MSSKRKSKSKQLHQPLGDATNDAATPSAAEPWAVPKLDGLVDFHLSLGWWLLLLFVVMGVFLESLHGFKVAWYLNVGQESRRLLWRLAHAHGTFLAIVNIAFAATVWIRGWSYSQHIWFASRFLLAATVLVPAGFFLGGVTFYANDPGLGIILLPIGALLLIITLLLVVSEKPRRA